jgi:hypothetical protein
VVAKAAASAGRAFSSAASHARTQRTSGDPVGFEPMTTCRRVGAAKARFAALPAAAKAALGSGGLAVGLWNDWSGWVGVQPEPHLRGGGVCAIDGDGNGSRSSRGRSADAPSARFSDAPMTLKRVDGVSVLRSSSASGTSLRHSRSTFESCGDGVGPLVCVHAHSAPASTSPSDASCGEPRWQLRAESLSQRGGRSDEAAAAESAGESDGDGDDQAERAETVSNGGARACDGRMA